MHVPRDVLSVNCLSDSVNSRADEPQRPHSSRGQSDNIRASSRALVAGVDHAKSMSSLNPPESIHANQNKGSAIHPILMVNR